MTFAQQNMYLNEDTAQGRDIRTFETMAEARAFINELNEGE